jgi:hypothetical protein
MGSRPGTWGYSRAQDEEDFGIRYERLLQAVHSIGILSGFCYTQFADTYQEANGLLYADRRPKIPLARIAQATRGVAARAIEPPRSVHDTKPEPREEPVADVQTGAHKT